MSVFNSETNILYQSIIKQRASRKSHTERPSVSFLKTTNTTKTGSSINEPPIIRKSKLFLAKNFVKSITPFLRSMKNINSNKKLEKPTNTEIFYYSLRKFLKEQIGINELMYAKNFPNKYYKQKKEEFRQMSVCLKNKEKNSKDNQGMQKINKSKTFNLVTQNQKSQAIKKFGHLWDAIKERVDYKKKIKTELEQLNPYYLISTSDEKFFANFYSATNDHIDKIRNKDLSSSNIKKFSTSTDLRTLKLKEGLLKRPKENMTSGKIHNTSNPGNNYLQQKFFNNNADLFLSQLNNEEEKELNFQALFAPSSSKVKSGTAKGRLNINSVQKNINLENSNFILSEIINRNNTSNTPKTYLESSFVRSNLQKSSYNESLKESFKETRERIVYDRKLTDYLHKKPNIFKVLTKYTSEINPVIAEIHNIESFNDKNMIETISKRNNLTFLKNKYENSTKKTTKKPQYNNNYFIIKRNEDSKTLQNLNDDHRNFSFDSDNQSLTEANLDNLYKESMSIQKRILEKKNDGVGKRLKQFIKLKSISKEINEINSLKLRPKIII